MAMDARRIIAAALEAALDDGAKPVKAVKPNKRRRLGGGRAFLLGAGIVTAARLASGPRARELVDSVQERVDSLQERLADYVEDGSG